MGKILTAVKLAKCLKVDQAFADAWFPSIDAALEKYEINTRLRIAAWIAQAGHESGDLKSLEVNLNFSATALMQLYGRHFPNGDAAAYERQPQKIANRIFANRIGNGNEASGDGWLFRGRGLFQITGKENYTACSKGINLNVRDNPELLKTKDNAAMSAAWYWNSKGLNAYADRSDFDTCTKKINGGFEGKPDRDARYQLALKVLADQDPDTTPDSTPEPDKTTTISKEPTPIAKKTTISEPTYTGGKSTYPNNRVYESISGHIIELDDTPGNERIHIYHRAGTYIQIDPLGAITIKAALDHTEITMGDKAQQTKGDETISVQGQSYKSVEGDIIEKSGGTITLESSDKVQVNAPLLTFDEEINGPTANIETITSTSVTSTAVSGTTVTGATVIAGTLILGGIGGFNMGNLAAALDTSDGATVQAKKPVTAQKALTTTEPTMLGKVNIQGFIDTDNSNAIVLCYLDTATTPNKWKKIKDDTVFTPKTDGSSGNTGGLGS